MFGPIFERFETDPVQEALPGVVKRLGGWQIRAWGDVDSPTDGQPVIVSPIHGRVGVVRDERLGYISIKGLGWTRGPLCLLKSPKDARLYFGLYPERDALREWSVSRFLQARGVGGTRALGYARNTAAAVALHTTFADGSRVEPCLLYSQVASPYRVADLPWLTEAHRSAVIAEVAALRRWSVENFIEGFCLQLARTMADYHRHGCVNDSLSADNITLAAEITDFEWFTTPEHMLPDGSQFEHLHERRRKEAIYAYEIGCLLCDALNRPASKRRVLDWMAAGYEAGDHDVRTYISSLVAARDGFAS